LELEQDFFQNFGLVLVLVGLILEKKPSGIGGVGGGLIPPLVLKLNPKSNFSCFFILKIGPSFG
jgi:hypothetical protein